MLDLDLDLEADLGVDTVKQAEMFAAVRAAYNIPRDENLKLRDFPTLAHVIKFAQDRSGSGARIICSKIRLKRKATQEAPVSTAGSPAPLESGCGKSDPTPRAHPDLASVAHFCKPTGVTFGRRVVVIVMPTGVEVRWRPATSWDTRLF